MMRVTRPICLLIVLVLMAASFAATRAPAQDCGEGGGECQECTVDDVTSLQSSSNPSLPGQSVTFTAHIAASGGFCTVGLPPTGAVTFIVDGQAEGTVTLDAGGTAALSIVLAAEGNHPVRADYAGDSDNYPSSTAITQVVQKAASTTSALLRQGRILVDVAGPGGPGGTVELRQDSTVLASAELTNGQVTAQALVAAGGQAEFVTSSLPPGTYDAYVHYVGDDQHLPSDSGILRFYVFPDIGPVEGLVPPATQTPPPVSTPKPSPPVTPSTTPVTPAPALPTTPPATAPATSTPPAQVAPAPPSTGSGAQAPAPGWPVLATGLGGVFLLASAAFATRRR